MIQQYYYDAVPTDAVGRSPLYRAVESGILDLVKILLEFYERKYDEFDRFNPKPKTISSLGSGSSASHQQLTNLNSNSNKAGSTTMSSSSTLFARSTNFFAARRSFSLLQAFPSTESLQVSLPESPSPDGLLAKRLKKQERSLENYPCGSQERGGASRGLRTSWKSRRN